MPLPNRRKLLIGAAAAGAAGVAGGLLWWQRPRDEPVPEPVFEAVRDPAFPNALRLPGTEGMYGVIDVTGPLTIVAKPVEHALLPGKPVSMLGFEVEHQGARYVNPVLRVSRGSTVRAKFWNALDETSNIHWHGLKVDANNDGHPHYAIPGSATYAYQYQVPNRAATYWYHPHAHGRTGIQIHQGLAGLFIVEDKEEIALRDALALEFGVTDVPLVIQDKRIDEAGAPVYSPSAREWVHGYLGSEVLVNLTPRPYLDVTPRVYRFRLLNASNARVYRLAFVADGRALEFQVLGGDGGLLDGPQRASEAFLASGERLDLALDARGLVPGSTVTLTSLAFDPMHREAPAAGGRPADTHAHHHGNHASAADTGGTPLADGEELALLKLHVVPGARYERSLPATLSESETLDRGGESVRKVAIDHHRLAWRINGRLFGMTSIGITVQRGAREIWEIFNPADGMPHPMHIHGFHFRVLERAGSPEQVRRLAVGEHGLTAGDLGWKDTVMIWPGETVRIALDFTHPFIGDQVYMFHCHNLQHADRGMMVNVKVAS